MKICIFQICDYKTPYGYCFKFFFWVFSEFGFVTSSWQSNLYCTLAAECAICDFGPLGHCWSLLNHAVQITNAKTAQCMSFELEEGEIAPYSELVRGLE